MGSFEAYSHTLFLPRKLVKTKLGAVKFADVDGRSIAVSREIILSANISDHSFFPKTFEVK